MTRKESLIKLNIIINIKFVGQVLKEAIQTLRYVFFLRVKKRRNTGINCWIGRRSIFINLGLGHTSEEIGQIFDKLSSVYKMYLVSTSVTFRWRQFPWLWLHVGQNIDNWNDNFLLNLTGVRVRDFCVLFLTPPDAHATSHFDMFLKSDHRSWFLSVPNLV